MASNTRLRLTTQVGQAHAANEVLLDLGTNKTMCGSRGRHEDFHGFVGHPSDGEDMKTSKTALEGFVSLFIRKGHFRHSVASI
jgi:hypothetical protein